MSRLIDADELLKKMNLAIAIMKGTMKTLGIEDEEGPQMELKAYEDIRNGIKDEPTIKPEPHWIPCSERLPEDEDYDETFTVTIQCEHVDGWDDYVTGYADWTPHGWDIQSNYLGQIKVTAWMPLPSPYNPESEE